MIKLNDICIQYTAWCRRDTANQFNTRHGQRDWGPPARNTVIHGR